MERNELISYAMDFASYLALKVADIDRILLFGSVARGDFDEKYDVDLFVDSRVKWIDKRIDNILKDYYKTRKYKEWQLKGIAKDFSVISGNLEADEWKNLKRAILTDGIILYGRFTGESDKLQQYTLFSFENIKPDKKRVSIFRGLFGFKAGKKEYLGLVEKIGGIRIGKGSVLVSALKSNELKKYLHEKKVNVKIYDV